VLRGLATLTSCSEEMPVVLQRMALSWSIHPPPLSLPTFNIGTSSKYAVRSAWQGRRIRSQEAQI
jgi:hypothetical protein